MFQRKIDKKVKDLPNVFGISHDSLVTGHDRDANNHDDTLQRVPQICRQVIL